MTSKAEQYCREAAKELKLSEAPQRKADAHKWAAAERMWKANKEEGATHRQIAVRVGLSHPTVGRHVRVFETWLGSGLNQKPNFTEAFYAEIGDDADGRTRRAAKQFLTEASTEEVEQLGTELPEHRRALVVDAMDSIHPALAEKQPLGVMDSVREMERNAGFYVVMQGSLGRLADAAESVRRTWDEHVEGATDEDKELTQEAIRDTVASLLALVSDPQELLT